jgi:Phosphate-selective porin O and P
MHGAPRSRAARGGLILLACFTAAVVSFLPDSVQAQSGPQTPAPGGPQNSAQPITIGRFTISGFVQADYRASTLNDAEQVINDSFLLRRARVAVSGPIVSGVSFYVQGELTDGRPRDVYVTLAPSPYAAIRVGQFVAPFGLERLTPSYRLEVIDRTVMGELMSPSRDLGVMVFSQRPIAGWLSYAAAVINGSGQNSLDNNDAKNAVSRVAMSLPWVRGLSLGMNVDAGEQPDGMRTRVGGDVNLDRPRYRIALETISQSFDGDPDRDARGVSALGVWRIRPAQPTPHYAGIELAARLVDIDHDIGVLTTREVQFGGNYYVTPQLRVMSNLIVPFGNEEQPERGTRWWSRLQFIF